MQKAITLLWMLTVVHRLLEGGLYQGHYGDEGSDLRSKKSKVLSSGFSFILFNQ